MKRLLKYIFFYLRYALGSIGTVFSAPILILYVAWVARKNKNSVIYLDSRHLGELTSWMAFMPAEEGQIVIVTDSKKKELVSLFSEKEVKFVFYGKLIRRCMLNQRKRPIFPGGRYSQSIANAKVLNIDDWDSRKYLSSTSFKGYILNQRAWAAIADPESVLNTSPSPPSVFA